MFSPAKSNVLKKYVKAKKQKNLHELKMVPKNKWTWMHSEKLVRKYGIKYHGIKFYSFKTHFLVQQSEWNVYLRKSCNKNELKNLWQCFVLCSVFKLWFGSETKEGDVNLWIQLRYFPFKGRKGFLYRTGTIRYHLFVLQARIKYLLHNLGWSWLLKLDLGLYYVVILVFYFIRSPNNRHSLFLAKLPNISQCIWTWKIERIIIKHNLPFFIFPAHTMFSNKVDQSKESHIFSYNSLPPFLAFVFMLSQKSSKINTKVFLWNLLSFATNDIFWGEFANHKGRQEKTELSK